MPRNTPAPAAVAFALTFAWILAAPWLQPWYAAPACALAAMFRQGYRLTQSLVVITALVTLFHNSGGHLW
ncbi:hypothetical protein, partial [Streptomyces erythrochromogenes]|uniref:hypothetical protein n=1 Tax=Streptomyces erythrochromogenes TaxID=285574 RepID=UPI0036841A2D